MSICSGIWHITGKCGQYRQLMNAFIYILSGLTAVVFFGLLIGYSCISGRSYRYSRARRLGISRSERYGLTRQSISSARFEEMRDIPLL